MATIPLPELSLQPPPQTDLLGQYGKVVALKSMLQQQQYQQQMQPLQLQEQQNTLAKQQQDLQDTKAGQAAYGEWRDNNYSTLASLMIKHGASLGAANQVAMYGLNQQKTQSEIIKNQGEGGKAQVETRQKNLDLLAGQLQALNDLSDDQLQSGAAAAAQTVQQGAKDGWISPQQAQTAQQLAQGSPQQIRAALPYAIKSVQAESEQSKNALEQAQTQEAKAKTVTAQQANVTGQLQADARNQWLAKHPGKSITDYTAMVAGQQKAAEEAGAFPYQAQLTAIREQATNTFWNNKDAMSEVENKYLLPYQQKMASVNELKSAVQMAQQGNVAAARGVLLKLIGVSNPDGTKRYNEAEAKNLARMGNVPERFQGTVQDVLTGDQWTPKMATDINSFADAQAQVAQGSLNSGIDSINTLHGTRIGQGLKSQIAPPGASAGQVLTTPPQGAAGGPPPPQQRRVAPNTDLGPTTKPEGTKGSLKGQPVIVRGGRIIAQ